MEQQALRAETIVRQIQSRRSGGQTSALVLPVLLRKQPALKIPERHTGMVNILDVIVINLHDFLVQWYKPC